MDERVVFVVASEPLELTSWETPLAVPVTWADEEVVDSATGVEAATTIDDEDEATIVVTADAEVTLDPDDPKLLDAVVDAPLLILTSLTITTSPLSLVTLISTVVVPKPAEFSKKL